MTRQLAELLEASRDPAVWGEYKSWRAYLVNVHGLAPYVRRPRVRRKASVKRPQIAAETVGDGDATTTRVAAFRRAAALVRASGDGLTVRELRPLAGWHHGQASSALSEAEKRGLLTRRGDRRERCAVYVSAA